MFFWFILVAMLLAIGFVISNGDDYPALTFVCLIILVLSQTYIGILAYIGRGFVLTDRKIYNRTVFQNSTLHDIVYSDGHIIKSDGKVFHVHFNEKSKDVYLESDGEKADLVMRFHTNQMTEVK